MDSGTAGGDVNGQVWLAHTSAAVPPPASVTRVRLEHRTLFPPVTTVPRSIARRTFALAAVLNGTADVALVGSGIIEAEEESGGLKRGALRVVEPVTPPPVAGYPYPGATSSIRAHIFPVSTRSEDLRVL